MCGTDLPWAGTALRVTPQGWGIPCLTPDKDGLLSDIFCMCGTFKTYSELMWSSLYPILTFRAVNRVLPFNSLILIKYFTYPGLLIKTKLTTGSDLSEQSDSSSLPPLTGEHCLHHHPKLVPGILFSLQEFYFCLKRLGGKENIQSLLSFPHF